MIQRLYLQRGCKRDRLQVYADILRISSEPLLKSELNRESGAYYRILNKALAVLEEAGYIAHIEEPFGERVKHVYVATRDGLSWAKRVDDVYQSVDG